ncbi:neuraminidase-like domain-containing protein, partial [Bacillus cereus]
YIDPSLRYKKTELFKSLEQNISQGRLTEDSIKTALQNYLNEYKVLGDLEYISVNKGDDERLLFFVGRTRTMPYEYFWRRLELKKEDANKLVPETWSEWKKITANIGEAIDNYVTPYWDKDRLHIQWRSIEKIQSGDEKYTEKQYINDWVMDSSGKWSPFKKLIPYNQSFQYSWLNVLSKNSIKQKYITYIGNHSFSNDPNMYNVTLTALPSNQTNVYFATGHQKHGAIWTNGFLKSVFLKEGEQGTIGEGLLNNLVISYLVGPLEDIEELKEIISKQGKLSKSVIDILKDMIDQENPEEVLNEFIELISGIIDLIYYVENDPEKLGGFLENITDHLKNIIDHGILEEIFGVFHELISGVIDLLYYLENDPEKLSELEKITEHLKELINPDDLLEGISRIFHELISLIMNILNYLENNMGVFDKLRGVTNQIEKILKELKNQENPEEILNKLLEEISIKRNLLCYRQDNIGNLHWLKETLNALKDPEYIESYEKHLKEFLKEFQKHISQVLILLSLLERDPEKLEYLGKLIEYVNELENWENPEKLLNELLETFSVMLDILHYLERDPEKLEGLDRLIEYVNELKKNENSEEILNALLEIVLKKLLKEVSIILDQLHYLERDPEKLGNLDKLIKYINILKNQENPKYPLNKLLIVSNVLINLLDLEFDSELLEVMEYSIGYVKKMIENHKNPDELLNKQKVILNELEGIVKNRKRKDVLVKKLLKSSTVHVYLGQASLYTYGIIFNNQFTPPLGSDIKYPINLSLENKIDLSTLLEKGLNNLFDYSIQEDKSLDGTSAFYGPY